ncbi:MAG: hypothetical protein ACOCZ8_00575 [Bacteroidota bacterium]
MKSFTSNSSSIAYHRFFAACIALVLAMGLQQVQAQPLLEFEAGVGYVTRNSIQVPGDAPEATYFDANEALSTNPIGAYRTRAGFRIAGRHNIFVLAAPLTARYTGSFSEDVRFKDNTYEAGTPVELDYTFNSYRLTYRYDVWGNQHWKVGVGLTGKIRDAALALRDENGGQWARTTDFGFVPLVNLHVGYSAIEDWWLTLNGDGLVNPFSPSVGRAFDYRLAVRWEFADNAQAFAGYRFIEGGADVDQVYNFAWINYGVVGLSYGF